MSDDRIWTLHPKGRQGVHITKTRYTQIKDYILTTLNTKGEMGFKELNDLAVQELSATFDGKIPWYMVTVKLDLEARGLVERVPGYGLQRLRLVEGSRSA